MLDITRYIEIPVLDISRVVCGFDKVHTVLQETSNDGFRSEELKEVFSPVLRCVIHALFIFILAHILESTLKGKKLLQLKQKLSFLKKQDKLLFSGFTIHVKHGTE